MVCLSQPKDFETRSWGTLSGYIQHNKKGSILSERSRGKETQRAWTTCTARSTSRQWIFTFDELESDRGMGEQYPNRGEWQKTTLGINITLHLCKTKKGKTRNFRMFIGKCDFSDNQVLCTDKVPLNSLTGWHLPWKSSKGWEQKDFPESRAGFWTKGWLTKSVCPEKRPTTDCCVADIWN